jgi:transposase
VSTHDHTLEPKATGVRRLEVITGTGRRRRFSEDDKARIIEETLAPGAVISEVARRHGLSPQQLFTLRRQARRRPVAADPDPAPAFVPAIVDASALERADGRRRPSRRRRPDHIGLWNIGDVGAYLLHFDVGRPDHLGPLLGIVTNELSELGG